MGSFFEVVACCTLDQGFSTFGTVGPVDKFFNQIGPANILYLD